MAPSRTSHLILTPQNSSMLATNSACKKLLLYYAWVVDNKLLFALSAITAHQAKATIAIEQVVGLLLNFVATYPNDSIVYPASVMILCALADAGFLNKTNSCRRAGAHIFHLVDDLFP